MKNNYSEGVSNRLRENRDTARLYALLTGWDYSHIYSMGIITSDNPRGEKTSSAENQKKWSELKVYLSRSNFVYLQVKGKYGNMENSVIIQNVTPQFMRQLSIKYNQAAFIYGEVYEHKEERGMKFEYFVQETEEKSLFNPNYGRKELVQTPNGVYRLGSTRFTYLKFDNPDDYYTRFKGFTFQIPFFDDDYDPNKLGDEKGFTLKSKALESIDKEELFSRIKEQKRSHNKTERSVWENRGMIKLMLNGEFQGMKYARVCE